MTQRCTIQRNAAATDEWGSPGAPGWVDHLTDVPCYAWVNSGREVLGNEVVVVTELHVYLPSGTDVTEADQIVSITDRRARLIHPGPMNIKSVDPYPGHLEATVISTL